MKKILIMLILFISWLWITSANNNILSFDNFTKINQNIKEKVNKKLKNLDKKQNQDLLKVLNNFIRDKRISYKISIDNSFILDLSKINNISYITSLTGNIKINLDKEFKKTMQLNNYDLSKFISFDMFKFLLDTVEKYPNSISCKNNLNINTISYFYFILKWNKIRINYETYQSMLLCYLKNNIDKYKYEYVLPTYSKPYRQHNISIWLSLFNNRVWKVWEKLNIWQTILDADSNPKKPLYVDWYVLKSTSTGWIEEPMEYGGGLCGVSTVFYQGILPLKNIEVLKRKQHSIFFKYLYGYNNVGQDANIYWVNLKSWKKKVINTLLLKNNQQDFFIKTFTYTKNKKFYTWIKFYGLKPIEKQEVKTIKVDKNNCAYVKRWSTLIKSCYKEIK